MVAPAMGKNEIGNAVRSALYMAGQHTTHDLYTLYTPVTLGFEHISIDMHVYIRIYDPLCPKRVFATIAI
jgi:hypothetical protein